MDKKAAILVVDDEQGVRKSLNMVLKDDYNIFLAKTGEQAIDIFEQKAVDLILLDIRLPDIDGVELLGRFKEMEPNTEIIMVTAVKEIHTAVKAIKLGAYEYIIKPFQVEDVLTVISNALEKRSLIREVAYLRNELERSKPFEKMVGENKMMKEIFDLISTISDGDGPVLIQGETGTGKELVARAIHNRGPRKKKPFVVVNCATIPEAMMESEIFGHNKGAFTGAASTRMGKLEIADGGTVLLDDIDSLDIGMQGKLLRAIQEKEFQRLGGTKIIKVGIRFLAASNKAIKALISRGKFREDLFFRLHVFSIELPPLRKRMDDIPLLLDHFLEVFSKKNGASPKSFSEKAMNALVKYDWPGNVRELENMVERISTVVKEPVVFAHDISLSGIGPGRIRGLKLKEAVKAFKKQYVQEVLESVDGSKGMAAEILGVHRNTILRDTD